MTPAAAALIGFGLTAAAGAQPVLWQPLPPATGAPPAAVQFVPLDPAGPATSLETGGPAVVWTPVDEGPTTTTAQPSWVVVQPGAPAAAETATQLPPASYAEAEARLAELIPTWDDYPTLLRLGQLPTAVLPPEGGDQVNFQQVSPGDGGAAGGSGNQNYGFRADLVVNRNLMLSGYYTYADDPLFTPIPSRPSQPANLWTIYGGSLRARLAGSNKWQLAAEGALELFTVGSGCGGPVSCDDAGTANIFNNSGQKVFTRNWVGALSLPLSWQANRNLQLSFVPAVSFLPGSQGADQGGAGDFYGTNVSLGVGANYRIGNQVQLFGSAMVPLGPGNNAFDGDLVYSRVPILSLGTRIAVNPRIGLEASVTNGFGLSPATAILALPSAPNEPMLSARFAWTPGAPDSPSPRYTARQASLALGGLFVNTALTPANGTTQIWLNGDSRGNLFAGSGYSVSNDFQFQLAAGMFNGIEPRNSFVNTFASDGGLNLRFGGKAMVFRPSKSLPVWAAGRISLGRNEDASSKQGYLFFETMNTWEATPTLAFNLNPKLAWNGAGTSWGVGLGANLQLGKRFQLIPELNLVATDLGGGNGTNGSLALRWLASPSTIVDVYVSNAAGLYDLGQLLGNDQVRVGARLGFSF
ncbi:MULTISPECIES: hypothetical protein [Cyanobium]|uniref:Porin n=1 Tax=Cyanobium usitatum str. Tous TaxID=2116684 RepID=A0A2P7N1G2_9CYAN|nr:MULTISPECIES: hypothetical protein [Cyanobium]MCP9779128.1 hypothetical protein [Cyanobium sp. To12R1]PSJ07315.1 hypothetical protein C7K55_00800 [Cyanobium usitatum str. Tous]